MDIQDSLEMNRRQCLLAGRREGGCGSYLRGVVLDVGGGERWSWHSGEREQLYYGTQVALPYALLVYLLFPNIQFSFPFKSPIVPIERLF